MMKKTGESPSAHGEPTDKGFLQVLDIRTSSLTLQPPALDILAGTNACRIAAFSLRG
jgi:hypothetical protein